MQQAGRAGASSGEDDWLDSLETTALKSKEALKPYREAVFFTLGALACFYGRRFTYSILFWRAFSASGWGVVRRAAAELRQRYRAAQAAAQRGWPNGLPSLQDASAAARSAVPWLQTVQDTYPSGQEDDLAAATRAGSALFAVSAELQPERLVELWRSVYAAVIAALSTAMADGAEFLGFGAKANIGDAVSRHVNRVMAPWLHSLIDAATARSRPEVRQLREDPSARKWIELAVDGVCNSVGVAMAFFVEARAFALSNARIGAQVMVRESCDFFTRKGMLVLTARHHFIAVRLAEWLLFVAGVYAQFLRGTRGTPGVLWNVFWGGRRLPSLLYLALGPSLVVESWLHALVTTRRFGAA